MNKNEGLQKLHSGLEKYSNSWIRPFVQLINAGNIPLGPMADTALGKLQATLGNMMDERQRVFFDELLIGRIEITDELVEDNDALHAFMSTYRAVLRTKTKEKIKVFARIFKNGIETKLISKADEYDYYLTIVDELSNRELITLEILHQFENISREQDHMYYWPDFYQRLKNELGFGSNIEIDSFLERLTRTGCFIKKDSATLSGGSVRLKEREVTRAPEGYLTPTYQQIKSLIGELGEEFAMYRKLRQ